MLTFGPHYLGYSLFIPKLGETIGVYCRELSQSNPIFVTVVNLSGSAKQGKVNLVCQAGPHQARMNLIWKENGGWVCWLEGKKYQHVRVVSLPE